LRVDRVNAESALRARFNGGKFGCNIRSRAGLERRKRQRKRCRYAGKKTLSMHAVLSLVFTPSTFL
jgi:hypothetical protein